jgi:hypothetical protein
MQDRRDRDDRVGRDVPDRRRTGRQSRRRLLHHAIRISSATSDVADIDRIVVAT